jgi:site-specific DNA-cytosine methylase
MLSKETGLTFRSITMLEELENTTLTELTSLPAAFRVRTLVSPDGALESDLGREVDCGRNSIESFASYDRVIRELRPRYVLVENVAALLNRGMGTLLGDLAAIRYDAEWDCIPACAFGTPHTRERVFIIAYPASDRRQGNVRKVIRQTVDDVSLKALGAWNDDGHPFSDVEKLLGTPGNRRLPNGVSSTVAIRPALRGYGNAVVPQVAEWIGKRIMEAAND